MKIAMIGSGNLATHLSLALHGAGMSPCQVYSPTLSHASLLASKLGCPFTDDIGEVMTDADAYIISIKDDAIHETARQLAKGRGGAVFIHTAGSVSIDVFNGVAEHAAVLYPMQSFTKGRTLCFKDIPCFIEATDDVSMHTVSQLAHAVCDKVVSIDSDKRKQLHLAAVFSCNLTNHCYHIAEKILQSEGLDFRILEPLIMETARKACSMSPHDAQTGPMVRNDVGVMQRQLDLITDPLAKEIYQLMAKSIYLDAQNEEK
ncbi:MAG: DUF2520 domain-containing protein [Prevotella sp.]|nr:DUF2520 domain-containing protein [Prevotella sp.]